MPKIKFGMMMVDRLSNKGAETGDARQDSGLGQHLRATPLHKHGIDPTTSSKWDVAGRCRRKSPWWTCCHQTPAAVLTVQVMA